MILANPYGSKTKAKNGLTVWVHFAL